ncbi:sigma factor [Arthrobacter sp. MDT2-2]
MTEQDELFAAHRSMVFAIAYEILGTRADAEDVVQDTYLRWAGVDLAAVRTPGPTSRPSPPARRSTRCGRWPAVGRTIPGPGCRSPWWRRETPRSSTS